MTDGVKISLLTPLPVVTGREYIPVALDGGNFGATPLQIATWLAMSQGFNRPPTGVDQIANAFDTASVLSGNLLAGASDPDGDTITLASVNYGGGNVPIGASFQALYGVVFFGTDGSWSYTLGSTARALTTGDVEHEIFTYIIADGKGGIATKHLTVTITGTNSAPIVSYVNGETPMNQTLAGNLLFRLAFDYETSVTIANYTIAGVGGTQPTGTTETIPGVGTINIAADGDYTFTPLTGFVGPAPTITYVVTDGVNNVNGFLTIAVNPSIAGTQPVVLYTDVVSGPLDDGGQAAGGAFLHIHGVRFGSPSDLGTTTKVYIGGVEVGAYVVQDVDPYARSGFGRQRIAVRVGALGGAALGLPLHIKVVVGGQDSNTDAVFTPNPGRIFYVSKSGNDSTGVIGDPTHPFRQLQSPDRLSGVYPLMRAGDQVIIRGDGGAEWTDLGYNTAWIRFRDAAQQGSNPTGASGTGWIALMGYPGEVVQYRTTTGNKGGIQGPSQDITGTTGDFLTISNLHIKVDGGATRDAGPVNLQYNAQFARVVGCELGPWVAGSSPVLNCAGMSGQGNHVQLLGLHIHNIEGTSAQQNHCVYAGTNSYGWEIAYCWMHDAVGGSLIQFNDSDGGTGTYQTPFGIWTGFTNIRIHHNWLENAAKYAIIFADIGAEQGELDFEAWCNMIIGTSLPPLRLNTTTATSDWTFAFNTIYNCNITPSGGNAMVRNEGWQQSPGHVGRIYDNIFAFGPGTVPGTGWLSDVSGFSNGITFSRNLYWVNGDTTAPAPSTVDALAVIGNPLFTNVSISDFTLQASSPAVNAATQALPTGMLVLDDYTGQIPRFAGGGPDLGCFEYLSPYPYIVSAPHFTGGPQVTVTTSSTFGTWANSPTSLSGQYRLGGTPDGAAIPGPGPGTTTPIAGDERQHLYFDVSATNGSGTTTTTLDIGIVVVGPGAPVNTVLPVVTGSLASGSTSSLSDGTWTGASGGFTYAWLRDSTPISGATANTYAKGSADVGHMLTGLVYAVDPVNGAPVAASVAVGPITPAPADPVVVQSVAHALTASTNTNFTFTGAVSSGDLVLLFLGEWDNAPYNSHYSDTQGHISTDMTRTTATVYNSTNPWIGWAYVKTNAAAGAGAYTMTVNPDSGQGGACVAIDVTALDVTTVQDIPPDNNQGVGTAITLTASAATTQAKDLVFVGVSVVGTGHTVTPGSGWTLVASQDGTFNGVWVFQRKESAIETFSFTATIDASTGWIVQSFVVKGST